MFPKTISGLLNFAAETVLTISGRLVPNATTTTPTTNEDTLNIAASSIALSTTPSSSE